MTVTEQTSELQQPATDATLPRLAMQPCPYCLESVDVRALKCRHCHSFLSERGRQKALREALASLGLRSVQVGKLSVLGLSLPGAAIFFVAVYFGMQGMFTILSHQPALLQVILSIVGVLLAYAFFREP